MVDCVRFACRCSIYFLQKWIPWYFERNITKKKNLLKELLVEKKQLLDYVRENEPYNKARKILEKYEGPQGDDQSRKPSVATPAQAAATPQSAQTAQRPGTTPQTTPTPTPTPRSSIPGNPVRPVVTTRAVAPFGGARRDTGQQHNLSPMYAPRYSGSPQSFALARPMAIKERTAFDRLLDFVVKDGPENRMALICRLCGTHNGLCLMDEYDYIGS